MRLDAVPSPRGRAAVPTVRLEDRDGGVRRRPGKGLQAGGCVVIGCQLFDDRGEVWEGGSARLADALESSIVGDELTDYAVRNLGFVAVSETETMARIRLRPSIVSPVALSALLYWLHDRPKDRFVLSFLESEWSHEVLGGRDPVLRRLMQRIETRPGDREGDFLQAPRPLHMLSRSSPLRAMLEIWSDSGGKYDRDLLHPLLEKALDGRFVVAEATSGGPDLMIKDVGSGMRGAARLWLSRSIGLRVEDQPDYAYGKWVAGAYRNVLVKGEPDLGDVDAVISFPQEARQSYRYRRLLLPFVADGRNIVLCTSLLDPDINLRVKPLHEVDNTAKKLA